MKNSASRHFSGISSLLVLAPVLLLGGCAVHKVDVRSSLQAAKLAAPPDGPELLAVYQPWFGSREHIDVGYSTLDQTVIQGQIEHARTLGISAFVVNWYGPRKGFMDRSYALLQQLAAEDGFQIAIQYDEPVDFPGHTTEAVTADLQYAYERYIGPEAGPWRHAYLRYEGRPVVLIFPKNNETQWDRVRQATQSWADPPLLIMKDILPQYANAFDGFYAWINPGTGGWRADGSNWGETYLQQFYSNLATHYPDKIAVGAAWPGFNDRQASWSRNRYIDARCGRTFEDSLRLFRRFYTDGHPLPFLLIETWNDYEEGSAIERGVNGCNGGAKNERAEASRSAAVSDRASSP
jgi:hypothetical protein